jgi:hypothetical protein
MPSPSLSFDYRNVITTTTRSAPNFSRLSFSCPFPLPILQNEIEFTCSLKQPMYACCPLNPGCRVPSNQVSGTLCHRYKRNYLFLTSSFALTRLHRWVHFRSTHLHVPTEVVASVFLCRSPQSCFQTMQHKVV